MPILSEALIEGLRQAIALYGLGPVLNEIRERCTKPHGRGRMSYDLDEKRLKAMGRHLAADKDLPPGKGALAELAKRAIADHPRPSDFSSDGSVAEHAVRRVVRKFDFFCFDLAGRGFGQGRFAPMPETVEETAEQEVGVPEAPAVDDPCIPHH